MSARLPRASMGHAVLLTSQCNGNRPLWSYLHTGTLPRLISFVSHSYENCRGVGGFFPNWNSRLFTRCSFLLGLFAISYPPSSASLSPCPTVSLDPLSATLTKNTRVGSHPSIQLLLSLFGEHLGHPVGIWLRLAPISLLSPSCERAWTNGPGVVYRSYVADRIVGPAL